MFRMLVHPSSGTCDLLWIFFMCCIALVRCVLVLRCGSAGVEWYPCAGWSLLSWMYLLVHCKTRKSEELRTNSCLNLWRIFLTDSLKNKEPWRYTKCLISRWNVSIYQFMCWNSTPAVHYQFSISIYFENTICLEIWMWAVYKFHNHVNMLSSLRWMRSIKLKKVD